MLFSCDNCVFLIPEKTYVTPHLIHNSKCFLSEYTNLTLVKLTESAGIYIRTSGFCMSSEACESSNLQNSVPLEGLGIAGALRLKMSYLIDL